MRRKLGEKGSDKRYQFTGIFKRFGMKNRYKGPEETVLLTDICDTEGNKVADHLWLNKTKGFTELNLTEGDKVKFFARVSEYEKGYKGYCEDVFKPIGFDYKLSYPTKIKKVKYIHQIKNLVRFFNDLSFLKDFYLYTHIFQKSIILLLRTVLRCLDFTHPLC